MILNHLHRIKKVPKSIRRTSYIKSTRVVRPHRYTKMPSRYFASQNPKDPHPSEPVAQNSNEKLVVDHHDEKDFKSMTVKEKFSFYMKKYGYIFVAVHLTTSMTILFSIYSLIKSGVDVGSLLEMVGFSSTKSIKGTAFIVALGIYKLILPLRLTISIILTPPCARLINRIRNKSVL